MELEKPVENVSESCQDVCLRAALDDLISPTFQRARGVPGQPEPAGRRPRLGTRAMERGLRVCPGRERGTERAPRLEMKNRDGKSRARGHLESVVLSFLPAPLKQPK